MSNDVFTEKDYQSGDGIITGVWGPPLWFSLHCLSFNYPIKPTKDQQEYYYNFFINLKNILPCSYCRDNLKKNFEVLPLTKKVLKNRDSFSRWVYELHELVNKMLGKKSNLTFEEVRNRFEHFRSRCLTNPEKKQEVKNKIENGCTEPLHGVKSRCTINIVPKTSKKETFTFDKKCVIKKSKK